MVKNTEQRPKFVSSFTSWVPLVVSLGVFCQLYSNGYLPAMETSRHLEHEEATVEARCELLSKETEQLKAEQSMLEDEIYRERVRRTLREPRQATLTLERARSLAQPPGSARMESEGL